MREIKFSKLNGQGNDFILINATAGKINLSKKQIIQMCDRNFGIGADGLILVRPSDTADLKMDFYNMDGSRAEMCGNGIRCMARFAYEKRLVKSKMINIETPAGEKNIFMDIKNKKIENIRVNMGIPEFNPKKIPVKIKDKTEIFNYKIRINSKDFYINCVSMGNPHCVIVLNDNENLEEYPVRKWGPAIENYRIFPDKINVEFIKIKNSAGIDMRVWERGAGETLSCGTGACAAGVCAVKLKKVRETKVNVNLPGGKSIVIWDQSNLNVYLEGRVSYKFDGIYFI